STLTLAKRARGSSSLAARSKIGAIARHGPHQGAQKSTITGMPLRSTCLSNVFDVNPIGSPANSLDLQTPHLACAAGRSAGMRLTAEQWGHTAWSGSVMAALSMADCAVSGDDARIFKCWNVSPILRHHEFVIAPYGNLRSRGGELVGAGPRRLRRK